MFHSFSKVHRQCCRAQGVRFCSEFLLTAYRSLAALDTYHDESRTCIVAGRACVVDGEVRRFSLAEDEGMYVFR